MHTYRKWSVSAATVGLVLVMAACGTGDSASPLSGSASGTSSMSGVTGAAGQVGGLSSAPSPPNSSADGDQHEHAPKKPQAAVVGAVTRAATGTVAAYGDTKGVSPAAWRKKLMPHLSAEGKDMFERTPPGPPMTVKAVGVGQAIDGVAVAVVQTNAGRLRLTLVWEDGTWLTDLISPTTDAVPSTTAAEGRPE